MKPLHGPARRGSWSSLRSRRIGIRAAAFVLGTGTILGSTIATAAAAEPVPEIPPFPTAPALAPVRTERHVSIARAALTYRLLDGREIEGWGADLYRPQDAPPSAASTPPASSPPSSADSGLSMRPPTTEDDALDLVEPVADAPLPAASRALIVMLPAGGFRTDLAASWAESFAKEGFVALALHRLPDAADEGIGHSLRSTARTFTQDAINLRRVVAWAAALPGVDPRRIGVLGVSRAAVSTALVAQSTPELSSVLVLGAADLTGLFRDSHYHLIEKMRTRELDRTHGDLDAAVARAAKILGPVDPATYPGRLDPARTLLINARWDHIFPRPQALALRAAAGGARQEWLPCGHSGTLLFAGRVRRLALAHFRATLGQP